MKNYKDNNTGGTYNFFKIKIFNGKPSCVEKEITEFIGSEPMIIDKVLQSESGSDDFGITITIFYYVQEPACFILKDVALSEFVNDIYDHFTKQYKIDFFDVLDLIDTEIKRRAGEKNTKEV